MSHQVTDKELLVLIQPLIQAQDQDGVVAIIKEHHPEDIADIFCEEFHLKKSEVQHVFLSQDGKTVYLRFDESEIGFSSEFLWDQNVRESFKKSFEVD